MIQSIKTMRQMKHILDQLPSINCVSHSSVLQIRYDDQQYEDKFLISVYHNVSNVITNLLPVTTNVLSLTRICNETQYERVFHEQYHFHRNVLCSLLCLGFQTMIKTS